MAFRTVVIAHEAEIHVHSGQLVVLQDERISIPTEDIAVLVLEHPRIRLSAAALSLLAANGVATAVCDDKHMPTGILLSNNQHSRQLAATRWQFAATVPQKKRLWQGLIQSKILNQAACLEMLDRSGAARLRDYASRVQSGDSSGLEATAARYYFPRLMPGINRHGGGGPDGSLDYGYAILRATVARSLVSHGLYPPLGIQHDGQLNAFNLADDLLEPFRPFVDLLAISSGCDVATPAGRAVLLGVLNEPCEIEGRCHSVLTGIEDVMVSFTQALSRKDYHLLRVPSLCPDSVGLDRIAE
jgi:CRISPR-associated protein Cas1